MLRPWSLEMRIECGTAHHASRPSRPSHALCRLVRELSQGLEKLHRLVVERGELMAGQSRLSAYGFTHLDHVEAH